MNTVQLNVRLTRDNEERVTKNGTRIVTLSVADNRRKDEEPIYWRCNIFGTQFDKMLPYLTKGSSVIIDGELTQPRIYNRQDGSPAVGLSLNVFNIRFAPSNKQDAQPVQSQPVQQQQTAQPAQQAQPVQQQYQQQNDNGYQQQEQVPF